MSRFFIPPLLPIMFTLLGMLVHYTFWRIEPFSTLWATVCGMLLIVAAVSVAVLAFRTFSRHGESVAINVPTVTLMNEGIYAISRNPIYASFLLSVIGIGCILNSAAVILAVIPTFILMNWYWIAKEERYLYRKFGAEYKEYARRVRRWV